VSRGKGAGRLFWRSFWRTVGSVIGLFSDAKKELKAGKRGPSRSTKTVASTKGKSRRSGGGGFTPVDGRGVDDIRRSAGRGDGWETIATTRPSWLGGEDDPLDPDNWPDPKDGRPAWQQHGLPSPEDFEAVCAERDAEYLASVEPGGGQDADPSSAAGGAV
jgi:hypothetical protein